MRAMRLLVACWMLLFVPLLAQDTSDPVSGNWGTDGVTFLELEFDGKTTVRGTAIWRQGEYQYRAPIRTGSFERKTNTVKLEGDAKLPDGAVVPYVIEGKVEKDTISGTFKLGTGNGQFSFKRL